MKRNVAADSERVDTHNTVYLCVRMYVDTHQAPSSMMQQSKRQQPAIQVPLSRSRALIGPPAAANRRAGFDQARPNTVTPDRPDTDSFTPPCLSSGLFPPSWLFLG